MVQIRLRALGAKNILEMVGAKRAAICPFRVAAPIPLANGNPTRSAARLPRPGVGLLEPRNNQRRFRLELPMRDIVIGQREVERILPRDKRDWNVIPARTRVRVVRAAVIRCPIKIPRTPVVRYRLFSADLFPHPETLR